MKSPVYVLDANVFIQAARQYYAFDIAPIFWNELKHHAGGQRVCSIDKVKDELSRQKDELAKWAGKHFHTAFEPTDNDDVLDQYQKLIRWVHRQDQYHESAIYEFAQDHVADAWLIAYAKSKGHILVTHETLSPQSKNRIPIPNVCEAFGIEYCDTFDMMRSLEVKFT